MTGTMNPYKYELTSSAEDWLWDTLDFETGIIREYSDMIVDGELTVSIEGTPLTVIPVITASNSMKVAFGGQTYDLKAGQNKFYGIKLRKGENTLTFTGNGTVTIDYRGGWL